jgi:hypothetical protein
MSENKLGSPNGYREGHTELRANVAIRLWVVTQTIAICPHQIDSPRHFENQNTRAVS